MYEEFTYLSANGKNRVVAHQWVPDGEIVGVVQFIHGMSEYMMLFEKFALEWTKLGYVFCGIDLLGHGKTVGEDGYGYFAPSDGWKHMVTDCHELTLRLKEEYPYSKLFVIGNSMGSFLARSFAEHYGNEIDGLVLLATGGPRATLNLGRKFVHGYARLRGEKHRGLLTSILLFGNYNRKIRHPKSYIEWSSHDPEVIKDFNADPARRFIFTLSAYGDLLDVYADVSRKEWVETISKDLPVFLCSGAEDPLGDFGKGVTTVRDRLVAAGIADVSMKLVPGLRHNLLNGRDLDEAWTAIFEWVRERT